MTRCVVGCYSHVAAQQICFFSHQISYHDKLSKCSQSLLQSIRTLQDAMRAAGLEVI